LESLRNLGECRSARGLPPAPSFTLAADPTGISFDLALAGALARFLRLEMGDVVCHLSELRVASVHLELSGPAVVAGIGLPPMPDAVGVDRQGGIRVREQQ
jgi:hypothetical protein